MRHERKASRKGFAVLAVAAIILAAMIPVLRMERIQASDLVTISGTVTFEGRGVNGITVRLTDEEGEYVDVGDCVTDENGNYKIGGLYLDAGTYYVVTDATDEFRGGEAGEIIVISGITDNEDETEEEGTEAGNEEETEEEGTEEGNEDETEEEGTEAGNEEETEEEGTEAGNEAETEEEGTEAGNEDETEEEGTEEGNEDETEEEGTEAGNEDETEAEGTEAGNENETEGGENKSYTCDIALTEKGDQEELSFAADTVTVTPEQDSYCQTVSGGSGNGAVSYESSNTDIATINSETGVVTRVYDQYGIVEITALKVGDDDYKPSGRVSYIIYFQKEGEFAFDDPSNETVKVGESLSPKALIRNSEDERAVSYVSSNTDVADVDSDGKVTGISAGKATITVSVESEGIFPGETLYYEVEVSKKDQAVAFENPDSTIMVEPEDSSYTNAASSTGDGEISYRSSDESVAEVNENGEVTRVFGASGIVTITAAAAESDAYYSAETSYTIYFLSETLDFVFQEELTAPKELIIDEKYQNTASSSCNKNTKIVYASSDTDIVSVDSEDGTVTALAASEEPVTITATIADDIGEASWYRGKTIAYTVIVNKKTQEITFEGGNDTKQVQPEESVFVNQASTNDGGNTITYTSSDASVAAVDESGKVTRVSGASGIVTITASAEETETYYAAEDSSYTIYFLEVPDFAFQESSSKDPVLVIDDTYTNPASSVQSNGAVTYESSKPDIISVDGDGKITVLAYSDEPVTIRAVIADDIGEDSWYVGTSIEYEVTVMKKTQSTPITFDSDCVAMYKGASAVNLPVGGDGTGDFGYASSDTSVVTVDDYGNLKAVGEGSAIIRVIKAEDDTYYQSAEYTYSVNVSCYPVDTSSEAFAFSGDKLAGESSWYTGQVDLVAAEGYKLSYDGTVSGNWSDKLDDIITKDGQKTVYFYIEALGADGTTVLGISDKMSCSVKRDTVIDAFSISSTFADGMPHNSNATVEITAEDSTSGIEKIESWVVYRGVGFDKNTVFAASARTVSSWNGSITIEAEKYNSDDDVEVHVKITDNAGNTKEQTLTLRFDTTAPVISVSYDSPNELYSKTVDETGYFASSRKATVVITERNSSFDSEEATAGIRITATDANGNTIAIDRSFVISGWTTKTDELDPDKTTHTAVVTFSEDANYEVSFSYTDIAGNKNAEVLYNGSITPTKFTVDTTAPSITVTYDTNDGDDSFADSVYFNAARNATIEIMDGNFDPDGVIVDITNTEGVIPEISSWSIRMGDGNEIVHTATVAYEAEGDYTFDISCKDLAGNENTEVDYGVSQAPNLFVIDLSEPVVTVIYDNNDSSNGSYFSESRTAAITINEHNFDASRVDFSCTADDNGSNIAAPTLSAWSDNGDEHTATITFEDNALYTWNVECSDKAGNEAKSMQPESFYVDQSAPYVTITGISNHSANSEEGNIGLSIDCVDAEGNLDMVTPVLTRIVRAGNSFTAETIEWTVSNIANGKRYTIQNLENDGIYRLTCTADDLAGNALDKITLIDENGNIVEEDVGDDSELLMFSVNRDGSYFWVEEGDYTQQVLDDYYVQSIDSVLEIWEVDVDPLESYAVFLNGVELIEGSDYSVEVSGGENSWYMYHYRLPQTLFAEEGENNVIIESVNKTETVEYSDIKNLSFAFVVDKTPPVITISGLENGGNYQAEEQEVIAIPTDDGGKIKSLEIVVRDRNGDLLKDEEGNDISIRFSMEGDELSSYLSDNNGQVVFTVPEGRNLQVEILCADCSVALDGSTNTTVIGIEGITVSSSAWVIFMSEYGTLIAAAMGGILALSAAGVLIVRIKRKPIRR